MKLRKILIFVLFMFASVFALNLSVNAVEQVGTEVDFTTIASKHSTYTDKWTYGDWTVSGGANNNGGWGYIKIGGKNTNLSTYSDYYVASPQVSGAGKKVTVNIIDGSLQKDGMGLTSWGVYVYSDANMTNQVDYVAGGTITKSAQLFTFTPSTGTTWPANSYFKVKFVLTNTSSTNGIVWLDNVKVYEETNAGVEPANPGDTFSQLATKSSLLADYVISGSELYNYELTNKIFTYDTNTSTADEMETLNGVTWTGANAKYYGYDSSLGRGMQIGSSKAAITSYTITSTESFENVKYVKINASGASGTNATIKVTIGGTQIGQTINLTTAATDYEFVSAEALNGVIQIKYEQSSATGVYFKSVKVMNEAPSFNIETASLRFGITNMDSSLLKSLTSAGSNVTYGVAYIKATKLGSKTFKEAITNDDVTKVACTPTLNDETYQFALVLTGIPAIDFDEKVTAAAYVCIDGTYYYTAETTYSVNTIATEYVTNQTSNKMVQEHLGMLTWLQTYVGE